MQSLSQKLRHYSEIYQLSPDIPQYALFKKLKDANSDIIKFKLKGSKNILLFLLGLMLL